MLSCGDVVRQGKMNTAARKEIDGKAGRMKW